MYGNSDNFAAGKVILALNKNISRGVNYMRQILTDLDVEKTEVIFRPKWVSNNSDIGEILLVCLKNKDKPAVIDAVEKLSASPYVRYAEPDYLAELLRIPNDPYFDRLWGMENIKAPLAWNYTTGSANVTVGIADTGIDHNHPDIRRNMWTPRCGPNIHGWNFVEDNDDTVDTHLHGTAMAGIAGAVGNNSIGVVGVCWNVRVAALRIGGIGNNIIDIAAAIKSIDFANRHNIPILNNSWGSRDYSSCLKFAIEQYDGLFVAASGNDGKDNDASPFYPASYDIDSVITVAASDSDNNLAGFSNYGEKSVDIAAPGTNILSLNLAGEYTSYGGGTSLSAPHVAGAAALLKSYKPSLTALQIKSIILSSAEKHPGLAGKVLSSGILNVNAMFETLKHELESDWRKIALLGVKLFALKEMGCL